MPHHSARCTKVQSDIEEKQERRLALTFLSDREPVFFLVSLLYRSVLLYIEHYDAALDNTIEIVFSLKFESIV